MAEPTTTPSAPAAGTASLAEVTKMIAMPRAVTVGYIARGQALAELERQRTMALRGIHDAFTAMEASARQEYDTKRKLKGNRGMQNTK